MRYGFFDDTGTGKTLAGIELIKQKKIKTLVVCKLSLITNAWMKDLARFAPELEVVNLWDLHKRKKKVPDHDVGIINYEQLRTTYKKLTGYQMVLADESSVLKDPRSQTTRAMTDLCDSVFYVYLFSGTPAPNNELEYWSQMRIINPLLLGRSFYTFRNQYCYSSGYGGYKWTMKPDRRTEFLDKISQVSRVIRKEDCLTLPERTFNTRSVELSKMELLSYRKMLTEMFLEFEGQEAVAANAAVKIMKLRQGTSGFYYDSDGQVIQVGNSKLKSLMELLEEIGNHQVIIWTHFRNEADRITQWMRDDGLSHARADGSVGDQRVKDQIVQDFMTGKVKYLVSHPASLGHGVTLTNCTYAVYFSLSHSFEQAYQSQDRIYRHGQRNRCTYYRLIVPGTVDEAILKALENKESIVNSVFSYLKRKGGK
jgi:SNF2 family DNA or RNA helicase